MRWGLRTPDYDPNAFFRYDLGMVVLAEPVYLSEYGALPTLGILDGMATQRGKQNTMFTAVSYGFQQINPVFVEAERVRMVADHRMRTGYRLAKRFYPRLVAGYSIPTGQ
jgi:hypothetical protein